MTYDKDSFLAGLAVGRALWRPPQQPCAGRLKFKSASDFTLRMSNDRIDWDGWMQYSTDGAAWYVWRGETISSAGGVLLLRGHDNTSVVISHGEDHPHFVFSGASGIECFGSLDALLDYRDVSAGREPERTTSTFFELFGECTLLTRAPDLPAATVLDWGYAGLFYGCTGLTSPPALPATRRYAGCYMWMFEGCTALRRLAALPEGAFPEDCCHMMYAGCSALKVSETQVGDCQYSFSLDGASGVDAFDDMFRDTGGTFTGTPQGFTAYYTDRPPKP